MTKPTRSMQWLFVNGRSVKSRTLTAALDQAYRSLTPDRRYPVAVLMVDLSPAELDVNVSPTKSEVKFHREGGVFDAVRRAVKDALLANGMIPTIEQLAAVNDALGRIGQTSIPYPAGNPGQFGGGFPPGFGRPEDSALGCGWVPPSAESDSGRDTMGSAPSGDTPVANAAQHELLDGLRILGQIDNTFILAENRESMLVIDQHVAHERILYEMLVNTRGAAPVERQRLITPETIPVARHILQLVADRGEEFAALGYELEPFGGDSLLVRSVPALGRGKPPLEILNDLLDEISEGATGSNWVPTRDDVYIMCSCKMAIKAGDPLGMAEMYKLVADLAGTENPYLCPHGRPITIVWPKSDIRRRFKR